MTRQYIHIKKKADTLIQPIEDALGIHIDLQIVSFADYYETLMDAFEHSKYDIVMVAGHLWLPFFCRTRLRRANL